MKLLYPSFLMKGKGLFRKGTTRGFVSRPKVALASFHGRYLPYHHMEGVAGDIKAKVVEEDGAGTLRRLCTSACARCCQIHAWRQNAFYKYKVMCSINYASSLTWCAHVQCEVSQVKDFRTAAVYLDRLWKTLKHESARVVKRHGRLVLLRIA